MKKGIKRTLLTLTIFLALFGATTGVLASQGYITWPGSQSFYNVKDNLSAYTSKMNGKVDKEKQKVKDKEQVIKDKEQTIKDKEQALKDKDKALAEKDKEKDRAVAEKQAEVDRKQKEIDELQKNQADKSQLDQAAKDMAEIEGITESMLESADNE